jgi:ABC-type molybdate transport system substrate-binding protein
MAEVEHQRKTGGASDRQFLKRGFMSLPKSIKLLAPIAFACLVGCSQPTAPAPERRTLLIFHHGSPTPAIEAAEKVFKENYPGVEVRREKDDALTNMRKVTDLGKPADLVHTDDYSIIPPVMFSKFANIWIRYAHDEMTIAYAANSKYANEINGDNWYMILERPDVKWGIADPNAGPDGYFSLGQIMLRIDVSSGTQAGAGPRDGDAAERIRRDFQHRRGISCSDSRLG